MGTEIAPLALIEQLQSDRKLANTFRRQRQSDLIDFRGQLQFARQIILSKPENFALVTRESFENAMLDLAMTGLSLQPSLSHVYLIPYKQNLSVSISYRGMENLVLAAGTVRSIQADLVKKADPKFRVWVDGSPPMKHIEHEKHRGARGETTHAYCIATYANGGWHVEDMDAAALKACEKAASSRSEKGGMVWRSEMRDEMEKKSVLRRAYKHWPQDPAGRLAKLMEMMDRLEPIDFKEQAEDPVAAREPTVMVNENDLNKLHAVLTDGGLESRKADRWLQRLAESWGYGSIKDLPASRLEEATNTLKTNLAAVKANAPA